MSVKILPRAKMVCDIGGLCLRPVVLVTVEGGWLLIDEYASCLRCMAAVTDSLMTSTRKHTHAHAHSFTHSIFSRTHTKISHALVYLCKFVITPSRSLTLVLNRDVTRSVVSDARQAMRAAAGAVSRMLAPARVNVRLRI